MEIRNFSENIKDPALARTTAAPQVLQLNVGARCNLQCKHCHVGAGPDRTEVMPRAVMEAALQVFTRQGYQTLDITGGAPEMNPELPWLLTAAGKVCPHIIVRTNLVILDEPQYQHFIRRYRQSRVEIVASLPYYEAGEMERVRGAQTFDRAIKILQQLNREGYGTVPGLTLNLVYNPAGAYFPPSQEAMEREYKKRLQAQYGIEFDHLFTIMNNPSGRFGQFLERSGNYEGYMGRLYQSFNPATLPNMMCRSQISVGYDGRVYDCDFNQALGLEITSHETIFDLAGREYRPRAIAFADHCYACTAGQGSSCGGATK